MDLYPFRFKDPLTGRWIHARYKATREQLALRETEWEITGPAEVRDVPPPDLGASFPMRAEMDGKKRG